MVLQKFTLAILNLLLAGTLAVIKNMKDDLRDDLQEDLRQLSEKQDRGFGFGKP